MRVDVHEDLAKGPGGRSTGTLVKHQSTTQATRALTTAEAKYYAVITGSG